MNSLKNKINKLYIFEGFDEKFIEKVIDMSRIEVFDKGEHIIKEGEFSKKAYIVVS
jgi:CRP-like cAMP-binding protein